MKRHGWKCVRENSSFAPPGVDHFPLLPRSCALGCILTPLRGCQTPSPSHRKSGDRVLPHTTEAVPFPDPF